MADLGAEAIKIEDPGTGISPEIRAPFLAMSIENLYNVGDAVIPEGWVGGSGTAESARVVVEDI